MYYNNTYGTNSNERKRIYSDIDSTSYYTHDDNLTNSPIKSVYYPKK